MPLKNLPPLMGGKISLYIMKMKNLGDDILFGMKKYKKISFHDGDFIDIVYLFSACPATCVTCTYNSITASAFCLIGSYSSYSRIKNVYRFNILMLTSD